MQNQKNEGVVQYNMSNKTFHEGSVGVCIPYQNRSLVSEKNGNRDTITVLFSYIRLAASYIASQLYLAYAKLYCPTGSFGGEYNITAA